jgi:chromosome segregation ATPase
MTAESTTGASEMSGPRGPSKLKKALRLLAVVIVLLGGAYLAGWLQARPQVQALEADAAAARERIQQLESGTTALQQRISALEGRRRLAKAATALSSSNFGIAEEELNAAAESLSASGNHAELASSVRALRLAPGGDLVSQRAALARLEKLFDDSLAGQP